MAWTTPMTFIATTTLTAAQMNTYVRDNTNFLYSAIYHAPSCKSWKTADILHGDSVWSSHALGNNDWDVEGNVHDVSTGLFTIRTAGVYVVNATVEWANNNTGTRLIRLARNTTTIIANQSNTGPSATLNSFQQVSGIANFSVNDTIEAMVNQTSGGGLNVVASDVPVGYSLAIQWIGTAS